MDGRLRVAGLDYRLLKKRAKLWVLGVPLLCILDVRQIDRFKVAERVGLRQVKVPDAPVVRQAIDRVVLEGSKIGRVQDVRQLGDDRRPHMAKHYEAAD